jgi:hypothetical protein
MQLLCQTSVFLSQCNYLLDLLTQSVRIRRQSLGSPMLPCDHRREGKERDNHRCKPYLFHSSVWTMSQTIAHAVA